MNFQNFLFNYPFGANGSRHIQFAVFMVSGQPEEVFDSYIARDNATTGHISLKINDHCISHLPEIRAQNAK